MDYGSRSFLHQYLDLWRSVGDGVVDGGRDLGAEEEGGGVLEIEHLVAELVWLGIHDGQLVGVSWVSRTEEEERGRGVYGR